MVLARVPPALCAHCDSTGTIGEPCRQPVCVRWGYHFIPDHYVEGRPSRHQIVGQLIDGEFLVVDSIGEGGMGEVHLALQQPLLRKVAIKVVKTGLSSAAVDKFRGEARAMGQLRHPNIVSLIKYGSHEGRPYFAMEFVEGGRTLKDIVNERLATGHPFEASEADHVIAQMFDGLESAHRLNLIHRDIKLENVLVEAVPGNTRLVRILDFGLAKDVGDSDQTAIVSGTPIYMAPEQFLGTQLGPWTDVYALGVMIHVMICGRTPLPAKSNSELKAAKSSTAYEAILEQELAYLPLPMGSFFRRALSREVAGRFRSIPEMREGWRRALEGLPPLPVDSPPVLPNFESASILGATPKTAVLGSPTSNPWQGTVILDLAAPDTGTPSASQASVALPGSDRSRRPPFLGAIAAAGVVAAVVWAIAGGSAVSGQPESPQVAANLALTEPRRDAVETGTPAAPPEPEHSPAVPASAAPTGESDAVGSDPIDAQGEAARTPPAATTLRIETQPPAASASLDGARCTTPCELLALPGDTLNVKLAGYVEANVALTPPAFAPAKWTLNVTLEPDGPPAADVERIRTKPKPKLKPPAQTKPKIDYDAL